MYSFHLARCHVLVLGGTKIFPFCGGEDSDWGREFVYFFDWWRSGPPIMEDPDQDLLTIIYKLK